MNEPLLIRHPIDLHYKSQYCTPCCKPIIEETQESTLPTNHSYFLAVVPIKEFLDSENFFHDALGKKTREGYYKCERDGFKFKPMDEEERNARLDELFAINTSTMERQGGRMKETYLQYPKERKHNPCPLHFVKTYCAFAPEGTWIGYADMLFCGEWISAQHFLGHKQYQIAFKRGTFMINLWFCMVKDIMENHTQVRYIQYHLMHVGKPGLDEWKRRAGLREAKII
jgi:hypothetical protein